MYSNLGTLAIARKDMKGAKTYFERALARNAVFHRLLDARAYRCRSGTTRCR